MRIGLVILLLLSQQVSAMTVKLFSMKTKQAIGEVELIATKYGVLIKPELNNVPPGIHGFHIHEHPSCDDQGMAAGGHFDPAKTQRHLGPYYQGHLGDLPALTADKEGLVNLPVLAPRVTLADFPGHALMLHMGGDTYSDQPKLGGGGARFACGVIKVSGDPEMNRVMTRYIHVPVFPN